METTLTQHIMTGITRLLNYDTDVPEKKQNEEPDLSSFSDLEIYDIILKSFFKGFEKIVIQQDTHPSLSLAYNPVAYQQIVDNIPGIPTSFISDFKFLNRKISRIPRKGLFSAEVDTINSEAFLNILGQWHNWRKFFARYPDAPGILRFSRPYFTDNNCYAIVEFSHIFPNETTTATVVVFENIQGGWQLIYKNELT